MYVVSFRVPFYVLGYRMFINGSCFSDKEFNKGEIITVVMDTDHPNYSHSNCPFYSAEVIDSRLSFKDRNLIWSLYRG